MTGFLVPAIWERVREQRAQRQAADERLNALSDAMLTNPDTGEASRNVIEALTPARTVVDFVGRSAELQCLRGWCADGDGAGARLALVTGPGGVGKTRLALQLAEDLHKQGWACRWVRDGAEAAVAAAVEAALPGQPVLLVVDYAETRPGLRKLLASAVASDVARLRVLLLARGEGEWWDRLEAAASPVGSAVARAMRLPLETSPGAELSDRELVAAAVPQFARYLDVPAPSGVEVELSARPVPLLVLHAAALVAVLRSLEEDAPVPLRVVADLGILDELLRHETRYWYASAREAELTGPQGLGTVEVQRCIAATSLLGADSETTAADLLRTVPGLDSDACAGLRRKTARWLSHLYPVPAPGGVGSIQPDLLAEQHITTQLHGTPELAQALREHLDSTSALRALTILTRAHAHQPHAAGLLTNWLRHRIADLSEPAITVAIETPGPLGQIMADVLADTDAPHDVLDRIARAMPDHTVALAEANLTVTQRITEDLSEDTDTAQRASWLNTLASRRAQAGRVEDAIAPSKEAVRLHRELAAEAGRFLPNLANSLNNLGNQLLTLRRAEEALTHTQEAVTIWRELAVAAPGAVSGHLAAALNNLGNQLSELGRAEEALAPSQEAVTIRRGLAEDAPQRFRPELAKSLLNLGVRLWRLGRVEEALEPSQEAVVLYRELAVAAPGAVSGHLAAALNNLGNWLAGLGRLEEALALAEEAVVLYRELAADAPQRFRPELAAALNNLGNRLSDLGRAEEALALTEEALTLCRELAADAPQRFRPELARSLYNLGNRLSDLGRVEGALALTEEAVTLCRDLAKEAPARFRPFLCMALNNLGIILSELGRNDDARAQWEEAAALADEPDV